MLVVNKINVFYGDVPVLWDVSFEVKEGTITVIVGPNGAGKTTLLKSISGLLTPRSGSIIFLGEHIEGIGPHRVAELGISHIPEGRHLFPKLTVLENLYMGAYAKRSWEKRNETLEQVFQLFPILKERAHQRADTLSGGEQQMLAIGRGLMSLPKLLIADEPSLGLAPKLVRLTLDTFRQINKEGITVLLVEQNVRMALDIADEAYVIETGRICLKGKGKELLENKHVKETYLGI